jgi:hypothetical protein
MISQNSGVIVDDSNSFTEDYDKIHFIPTYKKDKSWALQIIKYNKQRVSPLVERKRRELNRAFCEGNEDIRYYKETFDLESKGKMLPLEQIAKFINCNWKPIPVLIHINRNIDQRLLSQPHNTRVRAIDEFVQNRQQRERKKILAKEVARQWFNEINASIGLPLIDKRVGTFEYAEGMANGKKNDKGKSQKDVTSKIEASLKEDLTDMEDLQLFFEYVYKDDIEAGMELGIKSVHERNRFKNILTEMIKDYREVNCMVARKYISKTTGLPEIEYLNPDEVYTSNTSVTGDFKDIDFWRTEKYVSFSDFVKMFGAELTKEELQSIFDHNRSFNTTNRYISFNDMPSMELVNYRIAIGYSEWKTQNIEVWEYKEENGIVYPSLMVGDYKENKKSIYDKRHYNCWYKAYYISTKDKDFVFDFGKLNMQNRDGDDLKMSCSSLFGFQSRGESIVEVAMPMAREFNILYFKWQSVLKNSIPSGGSFNMDMLEEISKVSDDNAQSNPMEWLRRLKQTGFTFHKTFVDPKTGSAMDMNSFMPIVNTAYNEANSLLMLMEQIYQIMQRLIGFNDVSAGSNVPERLAASVGKILNQNTELSLAFIDSAISVTIKELGERLVDDIQMILSDKNNVGYEVLTQIIGKHHAVSIEAMGEISKMTFGFYVEDMPTIKQKEDINVLAIELAKSGAISFDDAIFIQNIENYHYARAILAIKQKKQTKLMDERNQKAFEQQMASKQADYQLLQAQIQLKNQGLKEVADIEGNWDYKIAELKEQMASLHNQQRTQGMKEVKEMTTESRKELAQYESSIKAQRGIS